MKPKMIFKICYWVIGMGGLLTLSYLEYCGVIPPRWNGVTGLYVAFIICLRWILVKIFPKLK